MGLSKRLMIEQLLEDGEDLADYSLTNIFHGNQFDGTLYEYVEHLKSGNKSLGKVAEKILNETKEHIIEELLKEKEDWIEEQLEEYLCDFDNQIEDVIESKRKKAAETKKEKKPKKGKYK